MNIYTRKNPPKGYYVYFYLRNRDSKTAKAGTPYYIGKGKGDRAWAKHQKGICVPKESSNILIVNCELTEICAYILERYFIRWFGRKDITNGILLNKADGGQGYSEKGKIHVKDSEGKSYKVSINDSRYISGEFKHYSTGMVPVKDSKGNNFLIDKSDSRYISGEVTMVTKNLVVVKDAQGKIFTVNKTDPRYLTGQLVSVNKGNVVVKDKNGNKFTVGSSDPRYLSGELVGATKGKISCYNIIENRFCSISKEEFNENKNTIYVGVRSKLIPR
jgi:hypothetical protein